MSSKKEIEICVGDEPDVAPPSKRVRLKWFALTIGGCDWSVELVDAETLREAFDGVTYCDGLTLPDSGHILISTSLSPTRRRTALLHELTHACLSNVASGDLLAHMLGCKPEQVADREERLVSYLAPILVEAMMSAKMLRFPRAPKVPR